jgi:hypothetical protein
MPGAIQRENREQVDLLKTYFYERNEPNVAWFHAMSMYRTLLGLRGFWPMTVANITPVYQDYGEFDLDLSVTGEGNDPLLALHDLAPYVVFDVEESHNLFRADEAALDIVGTEGFIHDTYKGLTIGLWCWFTDATNLEGLMSKWSASLQQSYRLYKLANDKLQFDISSTGANTFSVTSTNAVAAGEWLYVVGRYDPSTELAIFVGDDNVLTKDTNVTSIPASVWSGTANLTFGLTNASDYHGGRQSFDFLCCAALPDYLITQLYLHSKAMYGHV